MGVARRSGANVEIPPFAGLGSNLTLSRTVHGG